MSDVTLNESQNLPLENVPSIFLSASVPEPERMGGRYVADSAEQQDLERTRIREAILALVSACRDYRLALVFGGHPAISPLVDHASRSLGNRDSIRIYQSRYFAGRMPKVALRFPGLVLTDPMVTEVGKDSDAMQTDLDASVSEMRRRMLDDYEGRYVGAVFIGGMNGIEDEFEWFRRSHPRAVCFPIESTGGATRVDGLLERVLGDTQLSDSQRRLLIEEARSPETLTYRTLFRKLFKEIAV